MQRCSADSRARSCVVFRVVACGWLRGRRSHLLPTRAPLSNADSKWQPGYECAQTRAAKSLAPVATTSLAFENIHYANLIQLSCQTFHYRQMFFHTKHALAHSHTHTLEPLSMLTVGTRRSTLATLDFRHYCQLGNFRACHFRLATSDSSLPIAPPPQFQWNLIVHFRSFDVSRVSLWFALLLGSVIDTASARFEWPAFEWLCLGASRQEARD